MKSPKFRSFSRNFSLLATGVLVGVSLSLGISAVAQRGSPLPLDELRQFTGVFAAIKNNYVEPVEDRTLIKSAISGMLSDLDPHSAYLDADAFRDMQATTQGAFGGLGIEVGTEDGYVKVISPIEDTPAARAGVLAGDLIIRIDDQPTKGMPLSDAVKLMRGEPKTGIVLTIQRQSLAAPVEVNIVRDVIRVRSVRSKMLEDDVAYVRISQFQEKTGADMVEHLRKLGESLGKNAALKNAAPKGLVLDLRNDPGGLLNSAIGVSAAFLPRGTPIVSTDGRTSESRRQYNASARHYARGERDYLASAPDWLKTVPMVVLVNVGSASASEIVAGALQDHRRAPIVGNRTFGKGSVQVILPVSSDTAIKLTTSRYFTPSGRSIQATGIVPDHIVADTAQGDLFRLPREADLQRHLSNSDPDAEVKSEPRAAPVRDVSELPPMFEFGGADDFQLQQALNVLAGRPVEAPQAVEVASQTADTATDNTPAAPRTERLTITPDGVVPAQ